MWPAIIVCTIGKYSAVQQQRTKLFKAHLLSCCWEEMEGQKQQSRAHFETCGPPPVHSVD